MTRLALADRRAALISAAVRVIARSGLAAATTRAIVAEAGMPLGSFHYAFESRDDLIAAVIAAITDEVQNAALGALPAPDSPHADLAATLRHGLDRFLDLLVADPQREQALLELSLYAVRQNALSAQTTHQYRAYYRAAEHSLTLAAAACGMAWSVPPARAARLLVTVTDGITSTWLADRDTEAARETVVFAADALARLARPARAATQTLTVPSPQFHKEQPRAD
ncbi:TetR/AcrR family transcriptional regulator [Cryobacterium sp. W22_MBD10_FK3]|uniref:TetR/AcrR family transcriptional regulator n=1 Tax=Cryobacterium sp. W22_MBD10_FK3 TaxID=3240273 RepID=UPI003F93DB93